MAYTTNEDVAITKAWMRISLQPIVGQNQGVNNYWERVLQAFVEEAGGNENGRTRQSIQNRWSVIKKQTKVYMGIIHSIYANIGGGWTLEEVVSIIQWNLLFSIIHILSH